QNLSKNYGSLRAVHDLNLSIQSGQIYGILGPNGSGKTTTLGMLLGVINPSDGSYDWFEQGKESHNRKRIGAILEHPNFYPYLSGERNLRIVAEIKQAPLDRIPLVLERVNLLDRRKDKFQNYSLGMKQRLAMAATLLNNPDVLVFDEPTNGLDPEGISEVRQLIISLGQEGKCILLASHLLDEVEKTCSHVAILKKGKLLAQGEVSGIISRDDQILIASSNLQQLKAAIVNLGGINKIIEKGDHLVLNVESGLDPAYLNQFLTQQNIFVSKLQLKKKSLEEQFLEITR
ncbi:UNVERIFIED_CONTAM: hypothetical protein GTU68_050809, partial [Idotea baltica]|nr:hypothetical protein [Idotea baltica]